MDKQAKNTICLWYDGDAEDAARFYAETFPDSSVDAVHKAPGDFPSGKEGDDGPEVRKITHVLATIRSPVNHQPYLPEAFPHYGPRVIEAVKRFQAEHHQTVDGIVGPHTATQLAVALRQFEQQGH